MLNETINKQKLLKYDLRGVGLLNLHIICENLLTRAQLDQFFIPWKPEYQHKHKRFYDHRDFFIMAVDLTGSDGRERNMRVKTCWTCQGFDVESLRKTVNLITTDQSPGQLITSSTKHPKDLTIIWSLRQKLLRKKAVWMFCNPNQNQNVAIKQQYHCELQVFKIIRYKADFFF